MLDAFWALFLSGDVFTFVLIPKMKISLPSSLVFAGAAGLCRPRGHDVRELGPGRADLPFHGAPR